MKHIASSLVIALFAIQVHADSTPQTVPPAETMLGKGIPNTSQEWSVEDREHDDGPGRVIEVKQGETRVAALIYGEGQLKPYLAVYDNDGRRISNPGISPDGDTRGRFPHHRGIFIGWNHLDSNLGRDDLWHLRSGESMTLASINAAESSETGAQLDVTIHWISRQRDDDQDGLLLTERRRFHIAREEGRTWIDQHSELVAARDLRLGGDLQHAGLHFRADADVDSVRRQTQYLWSPADLPAGNGRIVSDSLQWVNFRFPLHEQWYSVTQLNHPVNHATELSWRDYGRFGFFFTDALKAGETRVVAGRFIFDERAEKGDNEPIRQRAQDDHNTWVTSQ